MFFGGGFPQQEFYMRRSGRWARQQDAQAQHAHSQVLEKNVFIYTLIKYMIILINIMIFSKQMDIPHSFKCYLCYY